MYLFFCAISMVFCMQLDCIKSSSWVRINSFRWWNRRHCVGRRQEVVGSGGGDVKVVVLMPKWWCCKIALRVLQKRYMRLRVKCTVAGGPLSPVE